MNDLNDSKFLMFGFFNKSIMNEEKRETFSQIVSAILIILGVVSKNDVIIIFGFIPLAVNIYYWYKDNVSNPIENLEREVKKLRKDINIVKELSNIKERLAKLETKKNMKKKGALDPFTFFIILIILILIILYLQRTGNLPNISIFNSTTP